MNTNHSSVFYRPMHNLRLSKCADTSFSDKGNSDINVCFTLIFDYNISMKATLSNYGACIEKLKKSKKMLTARDFIKAGIPSVYLSRMLKTNQIERVGRGIYRFPDGDYDPDYCLFLRYPRIVYSGLSALYFHGLTDRLPIVPEITLPASYNSSGLPKEVLIKKCAVKLFGIGISEAMTSFGNKIPCYDLERTVIELIKNRSRIDPELFRCGLHRYKNHPNKDLAKLMDYSRLFRVEKKVYDILEILEDE